MTYPTDKEIDEIESSFAVVCVYDQAVSKSHLTNLCAAARDRNRLEAENAKLREVLKLAVVHIEHMAKWIGQHQHGYSFESLGEDGAAIYAALSKLETGNG